MESSKLIDKLREYFDGDFRKKLKKEQSLRGMIDRMETKRRKLKKKLKKEKSGSAQKLIKKQLKVLTAQQKKAEKMRAG